MKRFALLLTLFLAACGQPDEVNVVEQDPLDYADTTLEDVSLPEGEDEEETPSGVAMTGDRYIIQPGDTLSDIAMKAGVDLATLMRWNVITDANHIFINQEIVLTGPPVIEYADAVVDNVVIGTIGFFLNMQGEDGPLIYWNQLFLDALDIRSLYLYFLRDGGEPRNIEAFASHLYDNAPVLGEWQELAAVIYADLEVDAFEAVPGRPGYYYALSTQNPDLLVGIINARTGELSR